MTYTNTPSDRVQVRQLGSLLHPGACALCGSGNCDDGYVDTGVYYEYEGQVYFCMTCAHQIVNAIGCLLPDESEHLRDLNSEMATRVTELENENRQLRDNLAAWNNLLATATSSGAASGLIAADPLPEPQHALNTSESADDGESEPEESTKGLGPDDAEQSTVRNRDSDFIL
jgi:hypothetical protein